VSVCVVKCNNKMTAYRKSSRLDRYRCRQVYRPVFECSARRNHFCLESVSINKTNDDRVQITVDDAKRTKIEELKAMY
jgi:hypothetical protein